MPPDVAVIVVVPADTAVANPEAVKVATPAFEELHATDDVRSLLELSEYLPVAINCCVEPTV